MSQIISFGSGSSPSSESVAFLLHNTPNLPAVTGDGTTYSFGAGQALVKIFDIGSNCTTGNGTGTPATFTAPSNGIFYLELTIDVTSQAVSNTLLTLNIVTTSRTYSWFLTWAGIAYSFDNLNFSYVESFPQVCQMSAGDTATFNFNVNTANGGGIPGEEGLGVNAYISGYKID